MADGGPFRIAKDGSITGPGLAIALGDQHPIIRGCVVVSVEQLNALYKIAYEAGVRSVAEQRKREKDRIRSVIADLELDFEEPLDLFGKTPK